MTESPSHDEADQRPEEAPPGQADEESAERGREPARSAEAERGGQGESRGAESGDETAQTGNPPNAG